jgi:plasmid stabilization system protein ParE
VDFQVLYTDPALANLEEVMFWSWTNHPETTEGFGSALLNHVDLLKEFPFLGAPVRGNPRIRKPLHSPLYVYYRVDEQRKVIEIVHFWHRSRRAPRF